MRIFKIIAILVLVYFAYKGFVAFKNFEIGTTNQMAKIEEAAGIEKEDEVIALLLFLGKSGKQTLLDASKDWEFEYKELKSITSDDSLIVSIKKIRKKI